jgi:release factor glutamine methyltransferase
MSTSIAEAILQGAHKLRQAGVSEARREAGSLLGHVLGRDRSFLLTHAEDALSVEQLERFDQYLERRAQGEPQQYIIGEQEFFGLAFEVTGDVLIPRPETELLVESALKLIPESNKAPFFCDVGSGSGCITIALLHELLKKDATHRVAKSPGTPGSPAASGAHAVALDVSPAALAIAKRNAARHSLTERIDFIVSDCFAALDPKNPAQSGFDLIVSNPPYVEDGVLPSLQREVRDFEPTLALTAGPDGLAIIGRLLRDAGIFLKPGGHLLLEIGFAQSVAVEQLIDPKIWTLLECHKDLQGIPRVVALRKVS